MATTDVMCAAQRPLAEFAYELKKKYNQSFKLPKKTFMKLYDDGEIQLSSVFENLFVDTRNALGKPTKKVSGDNYDFVSVINNKEVILGDMKTTVLAKDGYSRRFVIQHVKNKQGYVYAACWNWMTNSVNFFAIPPMENPPQCGYKIMVCPITGNRTGGWYNTNCAYNTWEEMVMQG